MKPSEPSLSDVLRMRSHGFELLPIRFDASDRWETPTALLPGQIFVCPQSGACYFPAERIEPGAIGLAWCSPEAQRDEHSAIVSEEAGK